jgi:hypothetical protein
VSDCSQGVVLREGLYARAMLAVVNCTSIQLCVQQRSGRIISEGQQAGVCTAALWLQRTIPHLPHLHRTALLPAAPLHPTFDGVYRAALPRT